MRTDIMIDLETLDVLPTATVLTIGAVKFDPFGEDQIQKSSEKFYVKVDLDSCDALGLTTVQRTGFIILPQALRVSIPPLVGAVIATFKETSLLSIVGLTDFLRVANSNIPGQTEFLGVKREGLLFICLIYWIGSYSMSKYSQRLEKQLGVGER